MPYPQVQFLPPIDVIPDFVQDQRHEPYLYLKQKIRLQESDGSNVPGFWMPPAGGIHIFIQISPESVLLIIIWVQRHNWCCCDRRTPYR